MLKDSEISPLKHGIKCAVNPIWGDEPNQKLTGNRSAKIKWVLYPQVKNWQNSRP